MKKTVFIGTIPDIFGYGISVVSDSKEGAMSALRRAYDDWKIHRPNHETTFSKSFQTYAGSVVEVEMDKSYHDNFNS